MKITIKEVAREANVSIATVSRVLNGKDKVKSSTRQKIEEVIQRMNFTPDLAARSIIMKETKTVGMIVPKLANEYWAIKSDVVQQTLWAKGYTLIICSTDMSPEKEAAFLNMFMERNVDGIIYGYTTLNDKDDPELERVLGRVRLQRIPIVSFSGKIKEVNCIGSDDLQGGTDIVEHLVGLGHRRIAFIGAAASKRELGYRSGLMQHRLPAEEALIIKSETALARPSAFGYESTKELLARGVSFTALFCANDLMAMAAIRALAEAGIAVPGQVSVVGFDDINIAKLSQPSLTTIRKPIEDMGIHAAETLLRIIQETEEATLSSQKKIILPTRLVIRESTGPAPSDPERS